MKKIIVGTCVVFAGFVFVGCTEVDKQIDKAGAVQKTSDSLMKEFKRVDESLKNFKKTVDSSLPTNAQVDSALRIPRKLKARLDSL